MKIPENHSKSSRVPTGHLNSVALFQVLSQKYGSHQITSSMRIAVDVSVSAPQTNPHSQLPLTVKKLQRLDRSRNKRKARQQKTFGDTLLDPAAFLSQSSPATPRPAKDGTQLRAFLFYHGGRSACYYG